MTYAVSDKYKNKYSISVYTTQFVTGLFLFFYPILPSYFKIAGYDSSIWLSIVFCILYFSFNFSRLTEKFTKRISHSKLIALCLPGLIVLIAALTHLDATRIVAIIFQNILVIVFLFDYFRKPLNRKIAIYIIIISSMILSVIGFIEFSTKESAFWFLYNGSSTDLSPELQIRGEFVRVETSFGHAISYGIYQSIIALICFFLLCKKKRKTFFIVGYFLALSNVFLSLSRGPILFFLFANIIEAAFLGRRIFARYILISFLIVAFVSVFSYLLNSDNSIISFFGKLFFSLFSDEESFTGASNPFEYRLNLLNLIPYIFKTAPLFGLGQEASLYLTFSFMGKQVYSIDNSYIFWLTRYGIFGLVGNISYFLILIYGCIKNHTKNTYYKTIIPIVFCYSLNLFSVASMSESKIWIIVFVLFMSLLSETKRNFWQPVMKNFDKKTTIKKVTI